MGVWYFCNHEKFSSFFSFVKCFAVSLKFSSFSLFFPHSFIPPYEVCKGVYGRIPRNNIVFILPFMRLSVR